MCLIALATLASFKMRGDPRGIRGGSGGDPGGSVGIRLSRGKPAPQLTYKKQRKETYKHATNPPSAAGPT